MSTPLRADQGRRDGAGRSKVASLVAMFNKLEESKHQISSTNGQCPTVNVRRTPPVGPLEVARREVFNRPSLTTSDSGNLTYYSQPTGGNAVETLQSESLGNSARNFPSDSNCETFESRTDKSIGYSSTETVEKPVNQSSESVTHKAERSLTSKPAKDVTNHPVKNTTNQPVKSSSSQPSENTANEPLENTVNQSVESTTSQNVENTTSQNVENTTSQNVENTTSQNVENTTSQNVENTTSQNVENTTSQNVENTTNEPVQSTSSHSSDNDKSQYVESPGRQPVDNTTSETVENTTRKTVESQSTQLQESKSSQRVESTSHKPVEGTTSPSVDNTSNQPVESPSSQPVENTTYEPVESTTSQSSESSKSEYEGRSSGLAVGNAAKQNKFDISGIVKQLLKMFGSLAEPGISFMLNSNHPLHVCSRAVGVSWDNMTHALFWLPAEPLWRSLQASHVVAADECPTCSPVGRLSVLHFNSSGSSVEGLDDLDGIDGRKSKSDTDVMVELGPCRWLETGSQGSQPVSADLVPDCCAESSTLLLAVPSASPGFVTLLVEPTAECHHKDRRQFSAEPLRQLVKDWCWVRHGPDVIIDTAGPAVNASREDQEDGGVDWVPCLRMPVWPAEEFRSRQRVTDFPPAEAREDICRFGVHLVPTGRPGSPKELSEFRMSFSRAEVVAGWHLFPTVRVAVQGLKNVKNIMKDLQCGKGELKMKSYHIKTAALWLCQDTPRESWTSATKAMRMILDRLEEAVNAGTLPCFFWTEIDLLAEFSAKDLEDMRRTLGEMRANMLHHLMIWFGTCFDIPSWLKRGTSSISKILQLARENQQWLPEGVQLPSDSDQPSSTSQQLSSESQQPSSVSPQSSTVRQQQASQSHQPSSHSPRLPDPMHHLRLFTAQHLIIWAVMQGIRYRPNAPSWIGQRRQYPAYLRISTDLELEWKSHARSGAYDMHRILLQAMLVAPDDLVGSARLTSHGGDIYTWDAEPLLSLLTDSNMNVLLGDPAAVGAWVRQQLHRPPEDRPEGLTAELDTPRGRVDLLLNSDLLEQACRVTESKPIWAEEMKKWENDSKSSWEITPFEEIRQELRSDYGCDMDSRLRRSLNRECSVKVKTEPRPPPSIVEKMAPAIAEDWKREIDRLLSGTELQTKYDAMVGDLPDRWQLRRFTFGDNH